MRGGVIRYLEKGLDVCFVRGRRIVFLENGCSNPLERLFFSKTDENGVWFRLFLAKTDENGGWFRLFLAKTDENGGWFRLFSVKTDENGGRVRLFLMKTDENGGRFHLIILAVPARFALRKKKSGGMHQTHAPIIIKRVIKLG